jgi:peptidoglycan/xylan/chitin deacetylase (PgdA/CDA1 family)
MHLSFPLLACCLAVFTPPAHAFQVADGMALLRQDMPANYCALTFDDGPGPYTKPLLDLLAERGIVATFFVLGQNAERRPSLIRRMLAEGHEVANHSYSHADMRRLKPQAQWLEMQKTRDLLRSLGAEVRYFRPPYGRYTPETAAKAEELGMTIMLWSLDSQDWKRHVSRLEGLRSISPVVQQSFPGMRGVFLFHDTHKRTVDEMADILDALVDGGCERFVTVSEYMTQAPREEEQRLSTQAPNEGLGEVPPPALAGPLPAPRAEDLALRPSEDAWDLRISGAGMRTLAAHPVNARKSPDMRTQPAHGGPGGSLAAPETLMTGIVTNEQPAEGRSPKLLFDPGLLQPAHKPSKIKQDLKRSNPG